MKKDVFDVCKTKEGSLETLKGILDEIDEPLQKLEAMNAQDENGKSVLYFCILNRKVEISQFLIETGADVNRDNLDGTTPLILAAGYGNFELVKQLIKNGAQIDAKRNDNADAAYFAAEGGYLSILKLLLENDPHIANRSSYKGRTLLGRAAYKGHLHVLEYLVTEHNVDINRKNGNGDSPIRLANLACQSFRPTCDKLCAIINFLKDNGATDKILLDCNCCELK